MGDEPGTMAAVTGPLDRVRALCEGTDVSVVNENAPTQAVIAGPRASVDPMVEKLAKANVSA